VTQFWFITGKSGHGHIISLFVMTNSSNSATAITDYHIPIFNRNDVACQTIMPIADSLQSSQPPLPSFSSRSTTDYILCDCLARSIPIPQYVSIISDSDGLPCKSPSHVRIPASIEIIKGFCHCPSLVHIEIPASVETIDPNSFSDCPLLAEIIFKTGSHLKEIVGFYRCPSLVHVEIPASVETIDPKTFSCCPSVTEIIFETGSHFKKIVGLCDCKSLQHIEIPASVEITSENGFRNCVSLNVCDELKIIDIRRHSE
jgi:hypothetical protein